MPDEFPLEEEYSDDSTPLIGDDEQDEPEDTSTPTEEDEQEDVDDLPVDAAPVVAPTAAPVNQGAYAQTEPVGMSDGLKADMSVYLPEEVVNRLNKEIQTIGQMAAQRAVQANRAQETEAQTLGVPQEYLPNVRRHMEMTSNIPDPRQQVQAAVLMEIHERAAKSGDFKGEMRKYLAAADGNQTPAEPAKPAKPVVKPLHADAQPTRPSIGSAAVRQPAKVGGNNRGVDQIAQKMPWLRDGDE